MWSIITTWTARTVSHNSALTAVKNEQLAKHMQLRKQGFGAGSKAIDLVKPFKQS